MPVIPVYLQKQAPPTSRPDEAPRATTVPIKHKHHFALPTLRLQLHNLQHEGSTIFLSNIKGNEDISTQVQNVLNGLYTPDSPRPGTRSITFILREYSGLAYTTGIELDRDHKEIHLNIDYFTRLPEPRAEILGVICHELVHCFQWDAEGTCPGGLIEGIADWVRLRAGLAAKHWKQEAGGKWDQGYQHTGYFLDYLERRFGDGTVRRINGGLREGRYDEENLFASCCGGKTVDELWSDYEAALNKDSDADLPTRTGDVVVVPTDTLPKHADT
ncbi:Hypothetical protein R9X50_00006900 [Acrodontium crateriforme]|uniref:Uncharacterized protein n=1 Tax=Acrodontium crateriforme TaxID=150365 RepID=A0AAQ3LZY8_9PEZI|nr:Hypothetical protein R9X50_00006900 [Acrodontium crateriforme]